MPNKRIINGINDNVKPYFYNSKGELTKYGLACGYSQKCEFKGKRLELYMEYNCIHVRQFDSLTNNLDFWNSFDDNLTNARKRYNQVVKENFQTKG